MPIGMPIRSQNGSVWLGSSITKRGNQSLFTVSLERFFGDAFTFIKEKCATAMSTEHDIGRPSFQERGIDLLCRRVYRRGFLRLFCGQIGSRWRGGVRAGPQASTANANPVACKLCNW
jgi:hypothetical protein